MAVRLQMLIDAEILGKRKRPGSGAVTRVRAAAPASSSGTLLAAAAVALAAWLVWELRSLIVPVCVGSLLATSAVRSSPASNAARIPRGLAVGLLLLMLGGVALVDPEQHTRRHAGRDRGARPACSRPARVYGRYPA